MYLLEGNYGLYKSFEKGTVDEYIQLIKEKISKNQVKE